MEMKTMTYEQVKKLNPCNIPIIWGGAIDAVEARNRGVSVQDIIWVAARVVDLRMFAIECAEHVLTEDSPQAAHDACKAARAFLAGEIDEAELRSATYAADAATYAADAATYVAARAATYAADAATYAAARAAAYAARAAAYYAADAAAYAAAEREWQFNRLLEYLK